MKATGIVRRIDDLGRIVIPKEIRRTMHIHEGSPLEIFTDSEGGVIFRKYSPVGEMAGMADSFTESLSTVLGRAFAVCDTDRVIAVSGTGKKGLMDAEISQEMKELIASRNALPEGRSAELCGGKKAAALCPIISGGDPAGAVMLIEDGKPVNSEEREMLRLSAILLGKQGE